MRHSDIRISSDIRIGCRIVEKNEAVTGQKRSATIGGDMVIRKNAKPTEPKQSTHARGVYELCGGLGEPTLHHIYENFPRKYPNFLF